MNKILLAFDGAHFSEGAFEFARRMNEINPVLLTGVFLPQVDYVDSLSYADGVNGRVFSPMVESYKSEITGKNIKKFETLCQKNSIEYTVHKKVHKNFSDSALAELKKETRFADLLVIGSESFYKNLGVEETNEYLKRALHGVECPVIVVPEKFNYPMHNIFAYDGSRSSAYAIKQFAYLFPEFLDNKTMLVYAKKEGEEEIPDEVNIEELVARHFPDISITKLDLDPEKGFPAWLSEKRSAIIVSGSFGRSSFSLLFKESFITGVIKDHQVPVFIAHR
jgi:nucleotide-binding universal stress UspA family protein